MDIPKLKLPEPLPNRKLSNKLEKFLNNKTIKKWDGNRFLSSLFYLYLFNKYKHSCVGLNIDLHIRPLDKQEMIFHNMRLNNAVIQLVNCIKKGMSTVIIPVSLYFRSGPGHANLLIYRKKDNVIEHFEPHGQMYGDGSSETELYNKLINQRLEDLVDTINFNLLDQRVKLVPANEVCPRIDGLQALEGIIEKNIDVEGGYCVAWSMFFAELVLKNPEYSSNELLSNVYRILDKMSLRDQSNYLRRIIRGYVNLIYEKVEKYFSFMTDNKFSVDNISSNTDKEILIILVGKFELIVEYHRQLSDNPSLTKTQFMDNINKKKMENPYNLLSQLSTSNITSTLNHIDNILHPSPASPGFIKSVTPTPKKASPKKTSLKPCPPGKERHPQTKRCRNIVVMSTVKPVEKPCPPGKERNPQTKRCRNIVTTKPVEKPCPPGKERNPHTKRCRNIKRG